MGWDWNYRVVKRNDVFAIHEVYYDGTKIVAISDDSIKPYGESFDELNNDAHLFTRAIESPVLNYDDVDLG